MLFVSTSDILVYNEEHHDLLATGDVPTSVFQIKQTSLEHEAAEVFHVYEAVI